MQTTDETSSASNHGAELYQRGGPTAALDAFLRFAYGDALVDELDPGLHDRMYANAEMIFTIEVPAFQAYRPDAAALRSLSVPARVLVGEDETVPLFGEAAAWLAERIGTVVTSSPGVSEMPLAKTLFDGRAAGAAGADQTFAPAEAALQPALGELAQVRPLARKR